MRRTEEKTRGTHGVGSNGEGRVEKEDALGCEGGEVAGRDGRRGTRSIHTLRSKDGSQGRERENAPVLRNLERRILDLDLLVDVSQARRDLNSLPDRERETVSLASCVNQKSDLGQQLRREQEERREGEKRNGR